MEIISYQSMIFEGLEPVEPIEPVAVVDRRAEETGRRSCVEENVREVITGKYHFKRQFIFINY